MRHPSRPPPDRRAGAAAAATLRRGAGRTRTGSRRRHELAHFGQRARAELIGRSEEKKSPAVEQPDPSSEEQSLPHIVRDEHHRFPSRLSSAANSFRSSTRVTGSSAPKGSSSKSSG